MRREFVEENGSCTDRKVQRYWDELSHSDISPIAGNRERLIEKIREK
ncbi:MAG: hypothetical protein NTV99_07880 [Deltaproteobacteria bacterium]|nr:hypothetical protein [Deltaproteobacteria bacterium]